MATRKSTPSPASTHAVSYIRMSSDKQDASPDQQREAVAKLARDRGFQIVREYSDLGVSGDATEKRLGFQKMIADAGKGTFRAILCWDQDRFGRFNSIEAGFWIHPLMIAGVRLVTVAQGEIDWTDFAGRMMYAIQQEGKHAFLRDLARNTRRGRAEAAKRGEWLGSPPFGYRVDAKRLAIVEDDAGIVRFLFRLYLDGFTLRGIAEKLNTERVRSASGNEWQDTVVRQVLRNHAYIGTYRWGFVKNRSKYVEAAEPIEIPGNHPPIVDASTFSAVQARLADRRQKSTPIRNGGKFLLTGLAKCAHCGRPMVGRATKSDRIEYSCGGHRLRGTCKPNWVKQDVVLDAVLGTIEKRFLDRKNLDQIKVELRAQAERQTDPKLADRLRKQVAAVEGKLAKATRRLIECESDMLRTVEASIRELRAERERLGEELKAASTPRKRLQAAADDRIKLAVDAVSRLRQTLQNDPMRLRELLREAVERIEVKAEQYLDGKRTLWRLVGGGNLASRRVCVQPAHAGFEGADHRRSSRPAPLSTR